MASFVVYERVENTWTCHDVINVLPSPEYSGERSWCLWLLLRLSCMNHLLTLAKPVLIRHCVHTGSDKMRPSCCLSLPKNPSHVWVDAMPNVSLPVRCQYAHSRSSSRMCPMCLAAPTAALLSCRTPCRASLILAHCMQGTQRPVSFV